MSSPLQRNFWWLWSSLIAMAVSLVFMPSLLFTVPFAASSGLALRRLLRSQLIINETNDYDLELQPLETAGTLQLRRLSVYQALRMAFATYMQGR